MIVHLIIRRTFIRNALKEEANLGLGVTFDDGQWRGPASCAGIERAGQLLKPSASHPTQEVAGVEQFRLNGFRKTLALSTAEVVRIQGGPEVTAPFRFTLGRHDPSPTNHLGRTGQ